MSDGTDQLSWLVRLGFWVRSRLADWGHGARLFARLILLTGASLAPLWLVRDQIHFLGNYSLAIITVSGLFVGLCAWGCRGTTPCSAMVHPRRWGSWWP
jgi:hypothetical protein